MDCSCHWGTGRKTKTDYDFNTLKLNQAKPENKVRVKRTRRSESCWTNWRITCHLCILQTLTFYQICMKSCFHISDRAYWTDLCLIWICFASQHTCTAHPFSAYSWLYSRGHRCDGGARGHTLLLLQPESCHTNFWCVPWSTVEPWPSESGSLRLCCSWRTAGINRDARTQIMVCQNSDL